MENLKETLEKYKIPLALSLVGIVLIMGGVLAGSLNRSQKQNFPQESLVQKKDISVDVSGAVKNAGVYQLNNESRVTDAISVAGGFLDQANKEFISKYLNLAQKLSDGSKIYIPFEGESLAGQGQAGSSGIVAGTGIQSKININTATQTEIESLPGIGPVTAAKIISQRPYRQVEELIEKKIVGQSVFEKIKDSVVVY